MTREELEENLASGAATENCVVGPISEEERDRG